MPARKFLIPSFAFRLILPFERLSFSATGRTCFPSNPSQKISVITSVRSKRHIKEKRIFKCFFYSVLTNFLSRINIISSLEFIRNVANSFESTLKKHCNTLIWEFQGVLNNWLFQRKSYYPRSTHFSWCLSVSFAAIGSRSLATTSSFPPTAFLPSMS